MPRTSKKQAYMGKLLDSGDLAYTECINCPDRDVTCKGPNLSVLDSDSYRAWIQLLMEELGWTHADLAAASGVPKGTIDNWLSGITSDVRRDTSWRIARALFGNREVCAPCPLKAPGARELNAKAAAYDELKLKYDSLIKDDRQKIDHLKEQVAFQKDQLLAKDNLLNERRDFLRMKDRTITILSVALVVAVLALISIFVVDLLNPNIGFFWRA